jgi:Zn-dependent M16 (insulinase) family peptidase
MDRVISAWIYGADPVLFLRMREHLAECRRRYEADPDYFNQLLNERVVNNNHMLMLVLRPDNEWQARTDREFAGRVEKLEAKMTAADRQSALAAAAEINRVSGTPNSPEALARLPQLRLADLPKKPRHIPTDTSRLGGEAEFLHNDVFANGVNYLHLAFDLEGLPAGLWGYLPCYIDALKKLGAAGLNYEQTADRIAASTGGIGCHPNLNTGITDPDRRVRYLDLSLKTLDDRIEPALEVLHDLLFQVDPRDRARLEDVVAQALARCRTDVVHNGATTAGLHAGRGLSEVGWISDIISGLPQLELVSGMQHDFDSGAEEIMRRIEQIRDFLLVRGRLTVSFTGSDRVCETTRSVLADWITRMRPEPLVPAPTGFVPGAAPAREGLAAPMQVAFCAAVMPAPHYSEPESHLLSLGAHLLSHEYILSEIRLRGNAYGAWCRYDGLGADLALGSYRDPNIRRTLEVFAAAADYVRGAPWTQTDVERAIISRAKKDETPIRPGSATGTALWRHLIGLTPELREERHARLVAAREPDVRRVLLSCLEAGAARTNVCVVSSREKLEQANAELGAAALSLRDIEA